MGDMMRTEAEIVAEIEALQQLWKNPELVAQVSPAVQALAWALGKNTIVQPVSQTIQGRISFSKEIE